MANNRAEIKYGSSGDDVKELQRLLNANGYSLDVDGVWGDNTDAAVRKYQKQNGLTVDGIVGTNTWGSLYGGNKTTPTPTTPTEPKSYSDIDLSKYDSGYQKSDNVIAADKKKTDAENAYNNYGDFSYSNQATLDEVMNKILNREQFSYDLNGDALYQQYKDKYIQQGKMAMQDTMGQAAAMTGGYGNSYAASVGNQAYQAQLNNLNDVIPELYQMAYDKYNQEGQDLYNQYGLLSDDRSVQYGLWGDKRDQLLADRDYYGNEANNAYVKDYGEWNDSYNRDYNQYWNETNMGYTQERDAIADQQWQAQFDEAKRQYDEQMAFQNEQYEYQKAQAAKAAINNTGGDGNKTDGGNTGGITDGMRTKAMSYESFQDAEEYIMGLEAAKAISHDEALKLMAEVMDINEKYIENDDGTMTISYKDMVNSTKGWSVESDGGGNWFGIDANAKVKSPNGEIITLKNLKKKLESEGMSSTQATNAIKKLQQNLDISSNWFFGL